MRVDGAQQARERGGVHAPLVAAKIRAPTTAALARERLDALLAAVWRSRLTLVVAPAGSGKTTLLTRFAATAGVPVAFYRAETWDSDETSFLRYLEAALTGALPGLVGGWRRIEDAIEALEAWNGGRALLIIDDLHTLEATPAEAALERLVDYAPPWFALVAGSRVAPAFNLSRLRVSDELLEIGPDDLRFRAWEVEALFRDFYANPVPPADLAVLARRTEGWAAGLQLFHLATRGKSAEERRRILAVAGSSGRLVREYLARNVIAELPDHLRAFLVETSVLRRPSGPLCDRLLGRRGSAAMLEELAHRQIFTVVVDDEDGSYRYHEVLRAHLDRMLVEAVGEAEARVRHARAGALLEAAGAHQEALGAYCRAEDWTAVRRLLGGQGERLAGQAAGWVETLPPAVVRHDPWLLLAAARRARADGEWTTAIDAYTQAEAAFGAAAAANLPRRERTGLVAWLDPVAIPPADWTGVLRTGLVREPIASSRSAARFETATAALVRGLLELAAGHVVDACAHLQIAAGDPGLEPGLAAAARLGEGVARLLAGDPDGRRVVDEGGAVADRLGVPWLARLAVALGRLDGRPRPGEDPFPAPERDPIGSALASLAAAWAADASPSQTDAVGGPLAASERRLAAAERAAGAFRRLGLGVLEAWARGLVACAQAEIGSDDARETALSAEALARATGTPGARLLAYQALAFVDPERAADYALLVAAARRDTGLVVPDVDRASSGRDAGPTRRVSDPGAGARDRRPMPTTGRRRAPAELAADPAPDATAVSPLGTDGTGSVPASSIASEGDQGPSTNGRRYAEAAGNGRHSGNGTAGGAGRGQPSTEAPSATLPDGTRVEVRVLGGFGLDLDGRPVLLDRVKPRPRAVLRLLALYAGAPVHREVICEALWPEADVSTGSRSLHVAISALRGVLSEAGGPDAARLIAREGDAYRLAVAPDAVDVHRFERAAADGRGRSDSGLAVDALERALDLYVGDLLPEDGPAEWVVHLRERYRVEAVDVARRRAEVALLGGDLETAVRVCRRGLAIDRTYDPLWRMLIEARDRGGDPAAASRERREYEVVLAELGVGPSAAVISPS